jgi:hypothetical protein
LADVSAISEVTSSDVVIVPLTRQPQEATAAEEENDKLASCPSSSLSLSFTAPHNDSEINNANPDHQDDPNSMLSLNLFPDATEQNEVRNEHIESDPLPKPVVVVASSLSSDSLQRELQPQDVEEDIVPVTNHRTHRDGKDLQNVSTEEEKQKQQETNECEFQIGDHVYQWCSLALIPAAYQHHGIVMDVFYDPQQQQWMLRIADFSNWKEEEEEEENEPEASVWHEHSNPTNDLSHDANNPPPPSRKKSFLRSNCSSCIRTYVSSAAVGKDRWYKVQYQAGWWKRHLYRSGTCTAVQCDAPGIVRARVQFLIDHPELLPKYNVFSDNCECVAVWCKTGTWATLQASSWLSVTAAGQAKSAVTVAGAVSAMQVSVPAAGAWGWLGYTQTVPLVSTQPLLLPAIAVYGVVTAGAPAIVLARAKHHWQEITTSLNTAFWEHAVANPTAFAECITEWSVKYEPDITTAVELTKLDDDHDDDDGAKDDHDVVAKVVPSEEAVFTIDNADEVSENDLVRLANNSNANMNEILKLENDKLAADLVVEQTAGQESKETGKSNTHKRHFLSCTK